MAAYASEDGILTEKMIDEKVRNAIKAYEKKVAWQKQNDASDSQKKIGTSVNYDGTLVS